MTMSCKGLTQSQNISVQLVITLKVSNSLDPNKAWTECRSCSGSKLFEKSYQQMTMSCKSLTQSLNISVQLQLVITYKVSNSLDPHKALTEYQHAHSYFCLGVHVPPGVSIWGYMFIFEGTHILELFFHSKRIEAMKSDHLDVYNSDIIML